MRNALVSSSAVLVLLSLLALGCTKSTRAVPDSGISFVAPDVGPDAGAPDAAPDGGTSDIGIVCMSDGDCDDAFCATEEQGFRDGYCTNFCSDDSPCPDGTACVRVGHSESICFNSCDPSADERQCRAGYGCAASVRLPDPVCMPGCTDDTDCDTDRTCNPASGGNCFNPAATLGDPCDDHAACPDAIFCFAEAFRGGWPGGMCVGFGCDPTATDGGGCPTDTVCIPLSPDFGACVPSCETSDECRDAYSCEAPADYPERLGCQPSCTDASQCSDGRSCGPEGTCV